MSRFQCSNSERKLGGALNKRIREVNTARSNNELIQVLTSIKDSGELDKEGVDYTQGVIEGVERMKFNHAAKYIFDIILAGQGLRAIK